MTVTTDETVNYDDYANKRVVLVHNVSDDLGERTEEIKGTVGLVNQSGGMLLIRPRGKTVSSMIEIVNIESIELDIEAIKPIKQRSQRPVRVGDARQHLALNHGWPLEAVNALSEDEAQAQHEAIDHTPLGHIHAVVEDKPSADEAESDSE